MKHEVSDWVAEIAGLRAAGWGFFDFLTAIDDGPAGLRLVCRLTRPDGTDAALVWTRLVGPIAPTLTGVFAGANWHERETAEMFGVVFIAHPGLDRLLLPDDFVGRPLRKDFALAARAVTHWPGAEEAGRRRALAIGVPTGWAVPDD